MLSFFYAKGNTKEPGYHTYLKRESSTGLPYKRGSRALLGDNHMSASVGTFKRSLLIAAGTLALGVGVIGIFIPLLPTTPLLLLAAFCYIRSSQRLYAALLRNRLVGSYVMNYMQGRGMSVRIKLLTLSLLWLTLGCSAAFATDKLAIRIVLLVVLAAVTIHIILLRNAVQDGPAPSRERYIGEE